jgi:clan AA aspartic protease (TIGR02281 family)
MRRLLALLGVAAALVATRGRADWSGVGGREVPLQGDGKTWTVRATLNGSVQGQFLFDTGATYCVISQSLARRLGLRTSGEHVTVVTANGQMSVPLVTIRYFDLGSNRARDVKAVIHDSVAPPLDGILGLSFLNNFAYVIDAKQRIVRLRPGG